MALLAVLLSAPSLQIGWFLDDYIHRAALLDGGPMPELARSPANLFAFVGERWSLPADFTAWWAPEDLRLAFFRPLAGLTHWLDYRL